MKKKNLKIRWLQTAFLAVVFLLAALSGCAKRPTGLGANMHQSTPEVKIIKDIPYYSGKGFNPNKHILDIYIPRGAKNFPVIFFVHGGAWFMGDKAHTAGFGMRMARYGIGVVNVNYRLYPKVKYPKFVEDVAAAYAWTLAHIDQYKGDPDAVFMAGHSAGGHLVALLAADDKYLGKYGIEPEKDIPGVIVISGVFNTNHSKLKEIFDDKPGVLEDSSPIFHVHKNMPPFLIFYADNDMEGLADQAEDMAKALKKKKDAVRIKRISPRNHNSILEKIGTPGETATAEILDFIKKFK